MIALLLLCGGALFLALNAWLGQTGVVGTAVLLLILAIWEPPALPDNGSAHDRRVAHRRWHGWHD